MTTRASMLRRFIGDQFAAVALDEVMESAAKGPLGSASAASRLTGAVAPLLLPHLVTAVEQVVVGAEQQPSLRAFAGGLLTYVYNPLDLLPDDGLFGWTDDAIVCALCLLRLKERGHVELDEGTVAVCTFVAGLVPELDAEFRAAVEGFIEGLWQSNSVQAPALQPG